MFKGGLCKGKLNGRCKLMTSDGKIRLKGLFQNGDIYYSVSDETDPLGSGPVRQHFLGKNYLRSNFIVKIHTFMKNVLKSKGAYLKKFSHISDHI